MDSKFVLGVFVAVMVMGTITLGTGTMVLQSYASFIPTDHDVFKKSTEAAAPTVITGDNVYITWFTNISTVNSNFEVGFRASNDSGATFGPITNISNTDNVDSINAEIAAEGGNIIVSWWERNQTAMVPVARMSTDNGQTFGNRLNITASPFGTIGSAAEGNEEE